MIMIQTFINSETSQNSGYKVLRCVVPLIRKEDPLRVMRDVSNTHTQHQGLEVVSAKSIL